MLGYKRKTAQNKSTDAKRNSKSMRTPAKHKIDMGPRRTSKTNQSSGGQKVYHNNKAVKPNKRS